MRDLLHGLLRGLGVLAILVWSIGCGSVDAVSDGGGGAGDGPADAGGGAGGSAGRGGGGGAGTTGGGGAATGGSGAGVGGQSGRGGGAGGTGGSAGLPNGEVCSAAAQCASGFCAGTCMNPAFGCPPDPSLRACYAFDEGAGTTFADGSGNSNTGSSSGIGWTTGVSGSAINIGDVSHVVAIPHSTSLDFGGQVTFEAWVKADARVTSEDGQSARSIVSKYDPNSQHGFGLDEQAGHPTVGSDTGYFTVASTYTMPVGTWVHLAAVADGTNVTLYANGNRVMLYSGGIPGTLVDPRPGKVTANQTGVEIGNWNPGSASGVFYGAIDVVRIYARAKTAAEICADANRAWSGSACTGT